MKQLDCACSQLVQKPFALSFQVPTFVLPDGARASRVIFPSGVKVILNLVPLGEAAVKAWPLKKVALTSLGAMGSPAREAVAPKSTTPTTNGSTRIEILEGDLSTQVLGKYTPISCLQSFSDLVLCRLDGERLARRLLGGKAATTLATRRGRS